MKSLLMLSLCCLVAFVGCTSKSSDHPPNQVAQELPHSPDNAVPNVANKIVDLDSLPPLFSEDLVVIVEEKAVPVNGADSIPIALKDSSSVHKGTFPVEKLSEDNNGIKAFSDLGNSQTFIKVVLILIFIYLLLNLVDKFLVKGSFLGRAHKRVANWVHNLFIIYEPVALLLITVSFVLINPLFFGLLVLIILLTGLRHLRNYFSGRLVQLDKSIEIGKQIKTSDNQGVIHQITRFGIRLKTAKGLQFLTYPQLIWPGYTMSSGEDLGGFYRLAISHKEKDQPVNTNILKTLLVSAPYLDWNHDIDLSVNYDQSEQVITKVLVREDHHLQNLIALIKEWGYTCKVSKK